MSTVITAALLPLSLFASEPFDFEVESLKIAKVCDQKKNNKAVTRCLNQEIKDLVGAKIDNLFREELSEYTRANELTKFKMESVGSFYDMYPVSIPVQDKFNQSLQCFNFNAISTSARFMWRETKIKQIAKAMLQTSIFLKRYAVFSFGKPFAVVLKISKTHVCNYDRFMKLNINDKILEVGVSLQSITGRLTSVITGSQTTSPSVMWDLWQKGMALHPRPDEEPWFYEKTARALVPKLNYKDLEEDERPYMAIYLRWAKLNPTGFARTLVRTLAMKLAYGVLPDLSKDIFKNVKGELAALKENSAKTSGEIRSFLDSADDSTLKELDKKISNPLFIGKVAAKHIAMASSSCAGAEAITKTKRGQKGLVNVMNLKAGAAYINFSYPEYEALNKDVYADKEKACASSKVEVDDEQEGKVNINLIDNGAAALSAAGLGTLTQAFDKIPQLAILEMIKEKKAARRP